jgi:isocitrate dehydrogenase kinase/phosphatase
MPEELIPIVLFISIAAVAILRPLTTRIGKVIEGAYAKKSVGQDPQIQRIMQLMERLVDRMDRLEDRVDFTERVLERQRMQAQLTHGPGGGEAGGQQGEG